MQASTLVYLQPYTLLIGFVIDVRGYWPSPLSVGRSVDLLSLYPDTDNGGGERERESWCCSLARSHSLAFLVLYVHTYNEQLIGLRPALWGSIFSVKWLTFHALNFCFVSVGVFRPAVGL